MSSNKPNPKALEATEKSFLEKGKDVYALAEPYVTAISLALSIIHSYVNYQQNKEIIKQLRVISQKLDVVINALADLKILLIQKFEDLQTDPLMSWMQTVEDGLLDSEIIPDDTLRNWIDALRDRARLVMKFGFAQFDMVAKAFILELYLCKLGKFSEVATKARYLPFFEKCVAPELEGTFTNRINFHKLEIATLEQVFVAGDYINRQYTTGRKDLREMLFVRGDIKTGFNFSLKTIVLSDEGPPRPDPNRDKMTESSESSEKTTSNNFFDHKLQEKYESAFPLRKQRLELIEFLSANEARTRKLIELAQSKV